MKKYVIAILFLSILIGCAKTNNVKIRQGNNRYIDSMKFRHYRKSNYPCLVSSVSYAYNDSMSVALDGMGMKELIEINSSGRSEKDPLNYTKHGDTIIVDVIHVPSDGSFCFGEIRTSSDSIFLKLSGDVYRRTPQIDESLSVPYRYFRTEFNILIKDKNVNYKIFYRYNDSFDPVPIR